MILQKCDYASGINILSKNSKVIQDDYDPLDDDDLYKDRKAFEGHHEDEAMQREDDFDEDSGNPFRQMFKEQTKICIQLSFD